MAQPTRPGQTPNLFNLNPLAYRLNQGGRQFNSVQRIRDNKDVEIEGGSAARLAGAGYEPILAQIRQAAQQRASVLPNYQQQLSTFEQKVQEAGVARREAETKAGYDAAGNLIVGVAGAGPVKLVTKAASLILEDDSAVNDFVRTAISDEAGDALNSVAGAADDVNRGLTMTGNAVGDVIQGTFGKIPGLGGVLDEGAQDIGAALGRLGSVIGGSTAVAKDFKSPERIQAEADYLYSKLLEGNTGKSAGDLYKIYQSLPTFSPQPLNLSGAGGMAGMLAMFSNAAPTVPTVDQLYGANPLKAADPYVENQILLKLQKQNETEIQAAQQQAQEEAARQEAARTASKNEYLASLGRTPGSASPDAGYDIPTEPISRGVQLANTSLYNDDLHQQMIARSK